MKPISILIIILIIILPLTIYLSSANSVIFDKNYYKNEFKKNNVYEEIAEADIISDELIDYLQGKRESIETDAFEEKEKAHLRDVKALMEKGFVLFYFLLGFDIVLFVLLLMLSKNVYKTITKLFVLSGLTTTVFPVIFFFSNFSSVFTLFHKIFFPQGNWQFSSTSNLIIMFPKQFFYDITKHIFLNSIFAGLVLVFIGVILILHKRDLK